MDWGHSEAAAEGKHPLPEQVALPRSPGATAPHRTTVEVKVLVSGSSKEL